MTVDSALVAVILAAAAAVTVHFLRRSLRAKENPCGTCAGCPHTAAGNCPVPQEACGVSRPGPEKGIPTDGTHV